MSLATYVQMSLDSVDGAHRFRFSVNTAAYKTLERSDSYSWAEVARAGRASALQFTGQNLAQVSVKGAVFPDMGAGYLQIEKMRLAAAQGVPLVMVAYTGRVLGQWVVLAVSEGESHHDRAGRPQKQDFNLTLKQYGGDL